MAHPRVELCGLCGQVSPVTSLVYRAVVFRSSPQVNYLYSSLPTLAWQVTGWGQKKGWGMFVDRRRASVRGDNTVTVKNGISCIVGGIGCGASITTNQDVPPGSYFASARVAIQEQEENQLIKNFTFTVRFGVNDLVYSVDESRHPIRPVLFFNIATPQPVSIEITGDFSGEWYFEDARISPKTNNFTDGAVENLNGPVNKPAKKSYTLLPVCGKCRLIDPESPAYARNPFGDVEPSLNDEIAVEDEGV